MSTLVDPFTDLPDVYRWVATGAMRMADGHLEFSYDPAGNLVKLESVDSFTFDRASVAVDLDVVGARYFSLQVRGVPLPEAGPYAPQFTIQIYDNQLYAHSEFYYASSDTEFQQFDYNPVAMRYLQMTSGTEAGQFYVDYQTSPDRHTWTLLYRYSTDLDTVHPPWVYTALLMSYYRAQVSDFNGGTATSMLWQKNPDGSYTNVGLPDRPLRIAVEQGGWLVVAGGDIPVLQKQTDGSWVTVATRTRP